MPLSVSPLRFANPNPYQLTMDDIAELSRLYPVTAQNLSSFPGKLPFASYTARIHGSVWFTDPAGNRTQPMQGVNVVARWIDPATQQPSRRYAASSVSGFLFGGDEGNPVTGFEDALGDTFAEWGSDSTSVEGFFDLSGLQIPSGMSTQYQLTVEPLDPNHSYGVGPYAPNPVTPSGSSQPIVVMVTLGQNVQQDILMQSSAQPVASWAASETWNSPALVPAGGDWGGSLGSYGDVAYFRLPVQSNRTLSVAVTALDQAGKATESKLAPVIGMWQASDPQGTAPGAFTPSAFNTVVSGMTRLDAQVSTTSNFIIGIADLRGDGRPDYHYDAHVLYADSLSPQRIGLNGGPITVTGKGFATGMKASIGGESASTLAVTAAQMILSVPSQALDGPQDITISDPVSGAATTMSGALTVGAAATDKLVLVSALNPPTPVGTPAMNPVTVRVFQADGVTPVAGATIGWTGSNGVELSACGGASACSATTDLYGQAATGLVPAAVGTSNLTATLAPGVYSPLQSVSTQLTATESSSDIGLVAPYFWVPQGATSTVTLTARVASNGIVQSNANVNFRIVLGTGSLSAASAQTNSSGYATDTLSLTQFSTPMQVTACVAPANAPCQTFYGQPVSLSALHLQPVAGAGQISPGQPFQPVMVRVTDSSSPPNPVQGATVTFLTTVLRPGGPSSGGGGAVHVSSNPVISSPRATASNPAMPVILATTQNSVVSDSNGIASLVPSSAGIGGPVEVDVAVTAGANTLLDFPLQLLPSNGSNSDARVPVLRAPLRLGPSRVIENR